MAPREHVYSTKTEKAIKDGLVQLLSVKTLNDITVSELAREAHVSRSTFYEHYNNPADVYDALVKDVSGEMSSLMSQVTCMDNLNRPGKPFCSLVRDSGQFSPVVRDIRFMDTLIKRSSVFREHDLMSILTEAGYTQQQADAICSFQMMGCYSAARASRATDAEWAEIRSIIDRFILGGIAACLATKS